MKKARGRNLRHLCRSQSLLIRTCLICLIALPTTAAIGQTNFDDILNEADRLAAGQKSEKQEDKKSEQDKGQENKKLTLDEIFAGEIPQNIDDLRAMQEHMRELANKLKPATVSLRVGQAQGSGVIVSRDGYVLTAAHVIGKPGQPVTVIFPDGKEVRAKSLGLNHRIDSGLVKITEEGTWPYLDMGESETLKRGQWVMSIGHPGGFDKLRGPVVRVGRLTSNSASVVRTDCTLVGGDSGGPLFDMEGNVIGIHSRIGTRIEDNMHVPVDIYAKEWDDLENSKEVGRSRTAPTTNRAEPGFRTSYRLKVSELKPNGEKAGLKIGDTVKKFNGVDVKTRTELRPGLYGLKKGQEFELTIERDGKEMKIKIKAE